MITRELQDSFRKIVHRVRTQDPANTRKWFNDLRLLNFDGGLLEIGCPEMPMVQFLDDNCKNSFTQAAQAITGYLISVEFKLLDDQDCGVSHSNGDTSACLKLHPDLRFENFVIGPCNRLAHASCIAVSNSPGDTYNPLFLYGSVGLGKTHLLHAICHDYRKRRPDAKISFLTCEEFVNRFIKSIEEGTVSQFQTQFRNVDILIIDDVQFLRERESSQEEFFHTFNALYDNRRQIVLSADCAPGDIKSLEERLVSRFKWGLVARIDAPSYETRVAIVQKKAHLRGLHITEEIAEYIAKKVKANIRELEGALTMLYAMAQAGGMDITLDLAQEAFGPIEESNSKDVSLQEIASAVTSYFDVRLTDLQGKTRSQSIAMPRQICMYMARKLTKHSLEEIGGYLGGRDHTTVMHAFNKIDSLSGEDEQFSKQLCEIESLVRPASK